MSQYYCKIHYGNFNGSDELFSVARLIFLSPAAGLVFREAK